MAEEGSNGRQLFPAPSLYSTLTDWWPLLSPPEEYEEEAGIYADILRGHGDQPAATLVEFGSGGGSNASFLKEGFEMTLVDISPGMLGVSRELNPQCEHIQGDMRSIRLGRHFDRVFIHDAICYMTTASDLRQAIETAFIHCRPGGAALFAPDYIRENFRQQTGHGGTDKGGRGLRYLEWTWDPDPNDTTYIADYVYLLRNEDGSVDVKHDRHIEGLFSRAEWKQALANAGFEPKVVVLEVAGVEGTTLEAFIGVRPLGRL